MSLPCDILERIRRDFGAKEADEAIEWLEAETDLNERERVLRCIVFGAGGELDQLLQLIDSAHRDYRDVIMVGEYNIDWKPVRDLRVSFLIDEPAKFRGVFYVCGRIGAQIDGTFEGSVGKEGGKAQAGARGSQSASTWTSLHWV